MLAQHKVNRYCYFRVVFLKYNHYILNKRKQCYFDEIDDVRYIAMCEGDDYWIAPNKLQKQVDLMETCLELSLIHTDCRFLNQTTGAFMPSGNESIHEAMQLQSSSMVIDAILTGEYKIRTASVLFRNSTYKSMKANQDPFLNSGYFLMGDIQLWIGLIQIGKVRYIPEIMVIYRITAGSTSRPKKYYDYIRFKLSSKELRIYYNQVYGYLQDDIEKVLEEYMLLLKVYNEYDSSYKGILEIPNLYKNSLQHLFFKIQNYWWHFKYDLQKIKMILIGR